MSESPDAPQPLTFAIVTPTYNEAADIGATCEALLGLTPRPDEIIFVDGASTDKTAEIIQRYLVHPSMRLIVEPAKRGISSGRNAGVRVATSDIVVFVDADVQLPPDFLSRLSRLYVEGADVVGVEAEAPNTESAFARFLEAEHKSLIRGGKVGWTQAFSCRRTLALEAGLFPEELPLGAEDTEFVRRLDTRTRRRVMDRTIVVRHVMPSTMRDFWRQWHDRGASLPFLRYRIHHLPWPRLIAERIAAAVWSLLFVVTVVPTARRAITLASLSSRRWRDLPVFLGLTLLQVCAHRLGEWSGLVRLAHAPSYDGR